MLKKKDAENILDTFSPEPVRLKTRVSWQPDRVFPEKTQKKRKIASCIKKEIFWKKVPFSRSKKGHYTCIFTGRSPLEQFLKNRFTWRGGGMVDFCGAKMARYLVFCNTFLCFSKCIKEGPLHPLLVPRRFSERAPGAQGGQKTQGSWQPDRGIPRKRKTAKNKKEKKHCKIQGSRAQGTQGNLKNIIFPRVF